MAMAPRRTSIHPSKFNRHLSCGPGTLAFWLVLRPMDPDRRVVVPALLQKPNLSRFGDPAEFGWRDAAAEQAHETRQDPPPLEHMVDDIFVAEYETRRRRRSMLPPHPGVPLLPLRGPPGTPYTHHPLPQVPSTTHHSDRKLSGLPRSVHTDSALPHPGYIPASMVLVFAVGLWGMTGVHGGRLLLRLICI